MPKYDIPVPTRAEWQKIRDTAKVPKGAAKVSIGDAIDKVHKSFALATITSNVTDTQQLITYLDTYITQTKAKYPAFEVEVKKVRKKAADHKATVKSIWDAREAFPGRYKTMLETYAAVKAGTQKPEKLGGTIEAIRGCVAAFSMIDPQWMAKQQMILQCHALCGSAETLTDRDKTALETMFAQTKL